MLQYLCIYSITASDNFLALYALFRFKSITIHTARIFRMILYNIKRKAERTEKAKNDVTNVIVAQAPRNETIHYIVVHFDLKNVQ